MTTTVLNTKIKEADNKIPGLAVQPKIQIYAKILEIEAKYFTPFD